MNEQTAVVRQHFGERAATYADMFDPSVKSGTAYRFQRRRRIIRELAAEQNGCLVDCATGTGEVTLAALETENYQDACINDVSPEMLSKAERLHEANVADRCSFRFVAGDVFDLPQKTNDANYDLVLCVGLLAHVGRLEELMKLCRTLVSDSGHILLQSTLLDNPGIRLTRLLSEKRHRRQKGYAIRHYKHSEIAAAAESLNLEIVDRRCFGLDVPFLDKVSPRLSHFLEGKFESVFPRQGAEAIYVLRQRCDVSTARQQRAA